MGLPPALETEKSQLNHRHQIVASLMRLFFALAVGTLISQIKLDYIEAYLYDWRFQLRPNPPTANGVVLISITAETVKELKGVPRAHHHAQVLEALARLHPRALFYDLDLAKVDGNPHEKQAIVNASRKLNHIYVGTQDFQMPGEEGKLRLPSPYEEIPLITAPKSEDINNFAKDHVSRRMLLRYQNIPLLQPILAGLLDSEAKNISTRRGQFVVMDTDQAFIDYHRTGTFPKWDFKDLLSPRNEKPFLLESLKGKIVIIGQDLQFDASEYVMTPFSREVVAMTRSEMHANIIDTLLRNSSPQKVPDWLNKVFVVLISLLTINVVLTARPMRGIIILLSSVSVFAIASFLAFWWFGFLFNMAHPLLTMFLSYYFFIPYRLIKENQRSWEYYQRNQLLSQVEELKSNFISMMSHDLKTPIARIQGMIGVILGDKNLLSSSQREAIDTIRISSDDLLRFINAILQYGKIESSNIQLHLQNKDINELLHEVIRKYEFLAQTKKIIIETELEPLFSIPVDPDLIRQVFSNLIENAIKYSDDGSRVLISSEEKENQVVVKIADQGMGIPSEDIPNLFMKFYRSKNAKSSPIKGSGLGLYLAKYFTELHQGNIFVESTYGQGSQFTVVLPLTQRRTGNA